MPETSDGRVDSAPPSGPAGDRLRAPDADGAAVLDPPARALTARAAGLDGGSVPPPEISIAGQSLASLVRLGRREMLELAAAWSGTSLPVGPLSGGFPSGSPAARGGSAATPPVILAGHQPALFHPGVWLKNFVLDRLARGTGAVAVNLLVDNDIDSLPGVLVPELRESGRVGWRRLLYDAERPPAPFELQVLRDPEAMRTFPQRLSDAVRPWVSDPLVQRLWRNVVVRGEAGKGPVGHRIAAGRQALEKELGLSTLEVPLSHLCRTRAFACFVSEVVERHRGFAEVYNRELGRYRDRHRIRNRQQPIPDLQSGLRSTELPFWIFTAEDPVRRRVGIEESGGSYRLTAAGSDWVWPFRIPTLTDQMHGLLLSNVCFRPRALTTTLFVRLLLGDLFLHGIGGAAYDQITDAVASGFFGVPLPPFATTTGTFRPVDWSPREAGARLESLQALLRELQYHPERHLDPRDPRVSDLIAAKRELIGQMPDAGGRRARHARMFALNASLREAVGPGIRQAEADLAAATLASQQMQVLGSREISFACHSGQLTDRLKDAALRLVPSTT